MMKCLNTVWYQRLNALQRFEVKDVIEEEKKNAYLEKRNKHLYKISQNL